MNRKEFLKLNYAAFMYHKMAWAGIDFCCRLYYRYAANFDMVDEEPTQRTDFFREELEVPLCNFTVPVNLLMVLSL